MIFYKRINTSGLLWQKEEQEEWNMKVSALLEHLEYTCLQGDVEREDNFRRLRFQKGGRRLRVYLHPGCCCGRT